MQQSQACSFDGVENSSPRFFLCARCRCQTRVCRRCDRGQIYCGRACAQEARRCKQREARARYQATARGRELHVQRSRRYRARHRRVTDQGLTRRPIAAAPAIRTATMVRPALMITPFGKTSCQSCGNQVSDFVRLSSIRRPLRRSRKKRSGEPACRQ